MQDVLRSVSPADPRDELGCFPVWDAPAVSEAVGRAREAFPAWRDAGLETRSAVLRRFADAAAAHTDELARLIAREMGKALWDASAEAKLIAPKVEATLGDGMRLVAPMEPTAGARASFNPRGVLAVLGPFNFPAHLPNGHIVPALATGNTVVFKPSELTPAVGDFLARLWRDAGLPPGVLETVQGGADTGRVLALHDDIDGVLFTGSYGVGRALAEATLDQPNKILALEMGGKNAIIVCDDADLDLAVAETALSMCASTGQRCTSASRLFLDRTIEPAFLEKLAAVLDGIVIGPPLEPGVFCGPLASRKGWDRFQAGRALGEAAGGERIYRREMNRLAPYAGPSLVRFPDTAQSHDYQREEMFGPELAVYPFGDLDEAVAGTNDSDFGLAASVMTRDRSRFDHCAGRIRTGILNWNKGTIGASGRLPFGGEGRSGNDRPAGITASLYCTTPQAQLLNESGFDPETLPPGIPRP